jgi:hypothetical protein
MAVAAAVIMVNGLLLFRVLNNQLVGLRLWQCDVHGARGAASCTFGP